MGTRLPEGATGKTPGPAPDDSGVFIDPLLVSETRRSTKSQERWAALKKLYDPHLLAHARSRMGVALSRAMEPDEVVDEAWIRVFESWGDFQYEKKHALRAWLCLQVDRVILDRCRRERRRPPEVLLGAGADSSTNGPEPAADASGPPTIFDRKDRRAKVIRAIEALPEIYRRALKAVWIEEKSRDEVARDLNLKPNTLTVQLKRGMELLRGQLDPDI
jgi:RNA polymerase sigma-70 factor (ECF subfamily)